MLRNSQWNSDSGLDERSTLWTRYTFILRLRASTAPKWFVVMCSAIGFACSSFAAVTARVLTISRVLWDDGLPIRLPTVLRLTLELNPGLVMMRAVGLGLLVAICVIFGYKTNTVVPNEEQTDVSDLRLG